MYVVYVWTGWWLISLVLVLVTIKGYYYYFCWLDYALPWVIEEFRKREQLSKASQGCPSWLKQWKERSALRLRLLTAIWILSWRSSRLCKGKLMVLETRMDKESSRGIGMRFLAPRLNNRNLIFFGSPEPALASAKAAAGKSTLGRALQWDALAFLPHSKDTCWLQTNTHTYTHI